MPGKMDAELDLMGMPLKQEARGDMMEAHNGTCSLDVDSNGI